MIFSHWLDNRVARVFFFKPIVKRSNAELEWTLWGVFYFYLILVFNILGAFLIKQLLHSHSWMRDNSTGLNTLRWLSTSSYPTALASVEEQRSLSTGCKTHQDIFDLVFYCFSETVLWRHHFLHLHYTKSKYVKKKNSILLWFKKSFR